MMRTWSSSVYGLLLVVALAATTIRPSLAFVVTRNNNEPSSIATRTTAPSSSSSRLNLSEADLPQAALTARGDCVFWFFGASGAAGIARSAFPGMFNNFVALQKLKDQGPTAGGDMLGINTVLCLYPSDVARADVEQIVNNPLTVEQIVEKFPVEGNFLTAKGYLGMDAFKQANPQANPLALQAVFDTFGSTPGLCQPGVAQAKLDKYKQNVDALKTDLLLGKLLGIAAIISLLGLLGIADIIAFSDVYHGWFPDWPGGQSWPIGMFTQPNGSPFKIPDYWI